MNADAHTDARLRLLIGGAVQGVGFRPFTYRLATQLGLRGWVRNSPAGVQIEVEGGRAHLGEFQSRILSDAPRHAAMRQLECGLLEPAGYDRFEIRESEVGGCALAHVLPDIATCADCVSEIFDPQQRRYGYPFTNCTNCGPRFSIITMRPYDRVNTTMGKFPMCDACRAEYENPGDRRFHAQAIACPQCGPTLQLVGGAGEALSSPATALADAAEAIRGGQIVALKGLGGFQLIVDARNERAVRALRRRKHRDEKPFAIMATDLMQSRALCEISAVEEALLTSAAAPIVLMKRRLSEIAPMVAPGTPRLGVMLPYTPLHHLLLAMLGFPVVATSGNLSDEPICTQNAEALERLAGVADLFLIHNREIARRLDDSIAREMVGRPMILRRARGYVPTPITINRALPSVLAVGAHLKSATAIAIGADVILSQHLGDLETLPAVDAFQASIADFEVLFESRPRRAACDLHPDYYSSRFAAKHDPNPLRVQHHYAHVLACMCENELDPPVLGIAWDGTGYGTDGTVWGGEFLRVSAGGFERANHLRTFRLPGGDKAVREPRRCALGVLYELFGEQIPIDLGFPAKELETLLTMLRKGINSPITSSAGRLFDAATALIGLRSHSSFEGQAAMELESVVIPCEEAYDGSSTNWEAIVRGILNDVRHSVPTGRIAARFHNSLVEAMVHVATAAGEEQVVLTSGCFQNAYLTQRAVDRLRRAGFAVYWHELVPPNDGGIALGQIVAAGME